MSFRATKNSSSIRMSKKKVSTYLAEENKITKDPSEQTQDAPSSITSSTHPEYISRVVEIQGIVQKMRERIMEEQRLKEFCSSNGCHYGFLTPTDSQIGTPCSPLTPGIEEAILLKPGETIESRLSQEADGSTSSRTLVFLSPLRDSPPPQASDTPTRGLSPRTDPPLLGFLEIDENEPRHDV